ncbi:MAG: hypothetical protein WC444_03530 [Candidatus Paceibacterota bacterium]
MRNFSMKAATSVAVLGGIVVSAVSASAALNLPTQSCSYSFNTNMKLGSRGTSVMDLQKVLNMYPQTQVSASGAGSPGMESSYFGAATRTAVNKFQALHLVELGISAPTGNVFAGTRGLLNQVCGGSTGSVSTLPAGCTSTAGFSPVTGASCATGTVTNPGTVVSGPVSAMLAGSQPTGMIVSGQSGARLADITFTGNGTVTSVQLQRTGVSADTTINNVYLYEGNTRITDSASVVTGGYINFNASNGLFTVNGSRTITVRADIASSITGQSVGVKLNSVTAGGSVSTFTNVNGNQLTVASVDTSHVNFAALTQSALTPAAGTSNYIVWSGSASVSTRSVNFKAATFKFVGSAPVDAIQNLNLFVDGSKVSGPVAINAANNNKVTFDLGATPYLLTTGTHTIEVRGDIVKGSFRTATFSVENVSDLMFEDSNLAGVNVSATIPNSSTAFTQSAATYGTITVQKGSVTVNVDPAFTASKVTGGATNVPVGQFTMKAYGEDVKVSTLRVAIATSSNASLTTFNNVSLYANGGQIGTSQNFTVAARQSPGYLTFTLGSSLIIPAGTTVTLTVKADIVDSSSAAYTSGTMTATISGPTGNAQGQSSYEAVDVATGGVAGNVLTISSGVGTFGRTSGFTAVTVAPNTSAAVKIASFTLQANSAEAVRVSSVSINPTIANGDITNYSNFTLKNGSTNLANPIGNPAAGTSTFSLLNDITIPASGTMTFDVYANVGGDVNATITTDMAVTSRGVVSNTSTVSSAAGTGATVTSALSTLAASTLTSSSPVAQYVVGGSTFGVATYKIKTAVAGTVANVTDLSFGTTGADAIQSITVTWAGGTSVSTPVAGSGDTATTTVSGLSIPVTSNGTDVTVVAKFSGFQNTVAAGNLSASIATVKVTLSNVKATAGTGSPIEDATQVPSNTMSLVSSKPIVEMSAGNTDTLVLGSENKVGEFKVTADLNGSISVSTTSLSVSTVGITNPEFTAYRIADGNTTITSGVYVSASSTPVFTFTPAYEIAAGQTKTFSVYANVAGAAQASITPYVTSRLTSASSFTWKDVNGGSSTQTGAAIYNFPTSSFSTKR